MTEAARKRVWFVVVLPPPVTGMTTVSNWMAARAAEVVDLRVLEVRKPARFAKLWPLVKHASLVTQTLRAATGGSRGDGLYFVMDSGGGILGSSVIAAIARLAGLKLTVHHHVFGYLNRPSRLASLFFTLCGPATRHVVLCSCMATKLVATYGPGVSPYVLSNANLVAAPADRKIRTSLRTVGFLGNITHEKGIDTFIDTVEAIQADAPDIAAVIAGPAASETVAEEIRTFVSKAPHRRRWIGAVYGADKEAFFDDIDLLLFPTRYENEAEPLTIYEALKRDIPVLGTPLGCIPDQIGEVATCPPGETFAAWAARKILEAHGDPLVYREMISHQPADATSVEVLVAGAFA